MTVAVLAAGRYRNRACLGVPSPAGTYLLSSGLQKAYDQDVFFANSRSPFRSQFLLQLGLDAGSQVVSTVPVEIRFYSCRRFDHLRKPAQAAFGRCFRCTDALDPTTGISRADSLNSH